MSAEFFVLILHNDPAIFLSGFMITSRSKVWVLKSVDDFSPVLMASRRSVTPSPDHFLQPEDTDLLDMKQMYGVNYNK